jgi:hypothetical protein
MSASARSNTGDNMVAHSRPSLREGFSYEKDLRGAKGDYEKPNLRPAAAVECKEDGVVLESKKEFPMTYRQHRGAVAVALTIAAACLLQSRPALAQGPYGRNSYEDFPFNQGSLFYRPLKPKPRPRVRVAPAPAPRGYGYAQPYTYPPRQQGYTYTYPGTYSYAPQPRYYYPTAPVYRVAPGAAAPAPAAPPATAAPAAPR